MGRPRSMYEKGEKCVKNFMMKIPMKNITWKTRRRWEDVIKMELKEIGCGLEASCSGYGPVEGCSKRVHEPWGPVKGREFLEQMMK